MPLRPDVMLSLDKKSEDLPNGCPSSLDFVQVDMRSDACAYASGRKYIYDPKLEFISSPAKGEIYKPHMLHTLSLS